MRLVWNPDPAIAITSFSLYRSDDKGRTYSLLATIAANYSGANYDKQNKRFFYEDAATSHGSIYKITVTGPSGTSDPAYLIAPPDSIPKCVIIGYIADAHGRPVAGEQVSVEAAGTKGSTWMRNPDGLVAENPEAQGVQIGRQTVYTDENGVWQVTVARKSIIRVNIPSLRVEKMMEVPDLEGPINFRDIIEVRGGSFRGIFDEQTGVPVFPR